MRITVSELVEQLKIFPADAALDFSGLDFYRLKMRGEKLVQVEFNQLVCREPSGKVVVENV